jgi:hypothetical protein
MPPPYQSRYRPRVARWSPVQHLDGMAVRGKSSRYFPPSENTEYIEDRDVAPIRVTAAAK